MSSKHLCLFECRDKDSDSEKFPDEGYHQKKQKLNSWYFRMSNTEKLKEGPNINLKYFKNSYDTEEEKNFITKKIRKKKKTELCKNWEIYHDCFFKNECSFAHGIDELRTSTPNRGNKKKLCKAFQEKGFCLFGKRCNYRHVIKEKLLFTYESVLQRTSQEIINEASKKENKEFSFLKIYKIILLKRKIIM